ncbi:MAG: discoidin domain-containing protein [Kofleriaceae bacterium]
MNKQYELCPVCTEIAKTKFAMKRDPSLHDRCEPRFPYGITASGDDGNKPGNVDDGEFTTRWAVNGSGQWLQLDQGSEQTVSGVDIAWYKGGQRKSNYAISASLDGTTFADVATGQSSGLGDRKERIGFAPVKARYVRVTVNGNTLSSWASFTEASACIIE